MGTPVKELWELFSNCTLLAEIAKLLIVKSDVSSSRLGEFLWEDTPRNDLEETFFSNSIKPAKMPSERPKAHAVCKE